MRIKSMTAIADKWVKRAAIAGPDYGEGVKTTPVDQAAAAIAAKDAYAAGVTEAIGRGAFEKGLAKAGVSKWKRKAVEVGVGRYPTGVSAGKQDYTAGYDPYRATIEALPDMPRGPRGSMGNYEISRVVGDAQHRKRIGG